MKRLLRSLAAVAVAAAASGALVVALAGTAFAATPPWEPDPSSVGGLTFYNSAGTQIFGGNLTDQPLAAYVQGATTIRAGDTKAALFAYTPVLGQAPGVWSGEQLSGSTTFPNASAPGSLGTSPLPLVTGSSGDETLATYESDFPNNDTSTTDGYGNIYVLRLKTSAAGQGANSTYDSADIEVNNTAGTWSVVYPVPTTTPTTTTLTTVPGSPQVAGTSVALDAAVSPVAAGTVQFEVNSSDIGTPVTVAGDGTASISTTTLPVGTDALSAVFTPSSGSAFSGSTGTDSFTVTAASLTPTTTSLTTVPGSPQVTGTSVALDAAVSPVAAGTVQFEVNSSDIGTPVTVAGDGTASISTTTLPVGTDALSAVFTPSSGSTFAGSTGTDSFTVTAAVAAGTTTALAVDPSTAAADTSVGITATVTQTSDGSALASGAGQVKFYDDGTDSTGDITSSSTLLGTVSLGTGGTASLSYSSFAVGAHNLVAEFLPTDTATYASSTSPAVLFTATTPTIAPASQTVDVSIPAGSLTITTPYSATNPFQLGTAVLDPTDSKFTASAPFGSATNPNEGVTITDTRAGDQPWTASATVTDFTDGSSDVINGQNLTFTGVTPSYISGNALQSGDVVTTDVTNSAIYGPTAPGSDGLKGGPHEFATAAAGAGSVYIYGLLTLTAPSSTPASSYTATLTFTIS